MTISFQAQQPDRNYNSTDSIPKTTNTSGKIAVRKIVIRKQPEQQDPLKDITPGTTERVEEHNGKKVKITTTTTVEKVNENTVIKIMEESKYHVSTKTRIIHPDGSQEVSSQTRGKQKGCEKGIPEDFVKKYLATQVKIGSID